MTRKQNSPKLVDNIVNSVHIKDGGEKECTEHELKEGNKWSYFT